MVGESDPLREQLSKSWKRIADLETRVHDLTLQTTMVSHYNIYILVYSVNVYFRATLLSVGIYMKLANQQMFVLANIIDFHQKFIPDKSLKGANCYNQCPAREI